jgi:pimeloyl-ACP methyl ester carboxylesterase
VQLTEIGCDIGPSPEPAVALLRALCFSERSKSIGEKGAAIRRTFMAIKSRNRLFAVAFALSLLVAGFLSGWLASRHVSLVIHGTEEPLVPVDHGMAVARLILGCRLHLIAGAVHMFFHRDLWAQLAAHILDHARADRS